VGRGAGIFVFVLQGSQKDSEKFEIVVRDERISELADSIKVLRNFTHVSKEESE
jgi:hypothetical protein